MCSSQVHIGVKLKKRTVSHHLFSVCLNLISVELNRSQMRRKPCWVCFDQLGGSWLFTPAFLLVVSQSRSCVCGYCVMAPSRLLDLHLNLQIHLYSVPKWLITTDTHFLWVTTEEWTAPTSGFTQMLFFYDHGVYCFPRVRNTWLCDFNIALIRVQEPSRDIKDGK